MMTGQFRHRLALLLLVFFARPTPAGAQKLFVKNYSLNEGLPTSQIFSAFQDERGYIWFGSPGGLTRYNGAEFKVFTVDEGLAHDSVRWVTSFQGDLWITGSSAVTRFDGRKFTAYTARDGLGKGIVWKGIIHQGQLWFGTSSGGLSRFDGKSFTTFTTKDGLPSDNVFALLSDGDVLWIGTREGGLSRYDGRKFTNFGRAQGLPSKNVMALAKHGSTLWVGTKDAGIFSFERDRFTHRIADLKVYSLARLGEQILWGTLGQGVIRMNPDGSYIQYRKHNGLTGDWVYSILVDRENTVWFTTNAGVTKLLSDKFVNYLTDKSILSIYEFDEAMWFGHLNDGVTRLKDGRYTNFTVRDGLWHESVWSMTRHQDKLWVATSDGLNTLEDERFEKHELIDGPSFIGIYHLLSDGDTLWLSTTGGICAFDGQRCRTYSTTNGSLPNDIVYEGVRFKDGICFATEGGVACIKGGNTTIYDTRHGLSSLSVYSVFVDSQGSLWAGTNRGLNRFDGERFSTFDKSDGLSHNLIAGLAERQGQLLVGTSLGLNIFSNDRVTKVFHQRNGLAGNEITYSSLLVDSQQNVWVGTTTGASKYIPTFDVPNPVSPPVVIESAWVNGRLNRDLDRQRLEHDQNNLTFAYAGLSFKDEGDVVYRYMLDGYDRDWSTPTRSRQVRYTNLPDGRFTFKVVAKNSEGVWSTTPGQLSFTLLPPFWNTWWFRLLAALLAGSLVYAVIQLRLRRVQRRNLELERIVEERTRQLIQANAELKELSLTDPLTGLHNRRYLREMIEREIRQFHKSHGGAERRQLAPDASRNSIGFLMVDIDHFKEVNDSYGHAAGDALLKQVSDQIRHIVRDEDTVIRWGGEEFLVVCKDLVRQSIHEMAQRVADGLREHRYILPDGTKLNKTCSIGFSLYPFSLDAAELFNYEEVINITDQALYAAKHSGRDMVIGIVEGGRRLSADIKPQIKGDLALGIKEGYYKLVAPEKDIKL